MDPSKTILRIYLSSVDVGAKIKACKTLSCADNSLKDGAMIDFSDAPDTAADGAKVDATFDLTLVNTFASVR